jgi:transposase
VLVIVDSAARKVFGPVRLRTHERERLLAALAPYRPLDVVVETSSSWPWLHDVVTGAGCRFVLAHARRLRAIAEANYKDDDVDAELLARMRLAGLIPEVHPSSREQRDWATLLRHRTTLVAERTRLTNRIHAQLHRHGLHLERGRLLTRAGRQQLRTAAWPHLTVEERALVRSHLRVIRGLQPLVRALDRRITQVAAALPEARLLTSVPGIGAHRALVLCAEALPLSRYRTAGHLAAYAGLVPRTGRSGQRGVRHGPIPAGANRWLRGALVRAVVSHVQHAPTSWLTAYYATQKARVGWPVARIATARKLARVVYAMLRTKRPWSNEPPLGESSTHRMLQAES